MLRILCAPALLLFVVSISASARPLTIYVATNGNDQWSGRHDKPSPDRRDGPVASLPEALKKARAARRISSKPPDRITILLRGGTYSIAGTIELSAEDSGSDGKHPFTIAAYPGEKPVLSGGRRIAGWKRVEGKPGLWQADVTDVRANKWYFHQLFINGQRRQRARTPNTGYFLADGDYLADKPVRFKYRNGDLKKEWVGDGTELVALHKWIDLRQFIRDLDEKNRVITLSGDIAEHVKEGNARYYIENTRDALDSPGEWYLDRKTGMLTYWAQADENLNHAEVVASFLSSPLLKMAGDFAAKQAVHDVVIRDLTFAHTDWTLPENGYLDTQAAVHVRGDVLLEGATNCRFERCAFEHLGNYALELGRGCQHCAIVANEFFDLGAGGIRIGETTARTDPFEQDFGHDVSDNHLHQLGRVFSPAVGIIIFQSGRNHVAHNHIHDLYYTAISVGWNWGYQETPCRDNVIEFNHLHDIGQGVLSDMGGIYTLGIQKGTILRNNLIHDVNSFSYGGWGLYTDEGSTDILLENNIVYHCKSAGFHQHYGRDNIIRNNVFAFGSEYQLMRTREEDHVSFVFTNNIVYFDSGTLLGSNWKNEHYVMDRNVYFDARAGASANAMIFSGADVAEWRRRGHDVHSLIADPLFVTPQKFDFRLKRNSPARQLGFKPVNPRKAGVRQQFKKQVHDTD
jgi:hypothetical protein